MALATVAGSTTVCTVLSEVSGGSGASSLIPRNGSPVVAWTRTVSA